MPDTTLQVIKEVNGQEVRSSDKGGFLINLGGNQIPTPTKYQADLYVVVTAGNGDETLYAINSQDDLNLVVNDYKAPLKFYVVHAP
jgi:hypothetical protein